MILYFVRHGKAVPAKDGNDAARELSSEGEEQLRSAAPLWRRVNLRSDVVFSSPLPRAMRSAELVCEAIGGGLQPIPEPSLVPGAGWNEMARALARHTDARRC